jgi:hypothetical protein
MKVEGEKMRRMQRHTSGWEGTFHIRVLIYGMNNIESSIAYVCSSHKNLKTSQTVLTNNLDI